MSLALLALDPLREGEGATAGRDGWEACGSQMLAVKSRGKLRGSGGRVPALAGLGPELRIRPARTVKIFYHLILEIKKNNLLSMMTD